MGLVPTATESKTGLASITGPMFVVSLFILVERPTGAYAPADAVDVAVYNPIPYALFAKRTSLNEQ
jgi:hypothetical protein